MSCSFDLRFVTVGCVATGYAPIQRGWFNGADRLRSAARLQGKRVSTATIHRHLYAGGYITAQSQKRLRSSYIRFAAEQPNERWQADFTHWWLADDTHVEILDWIDDHARYAGTTRITISA